MTENNPLAERIAEIFTPSLPHALAFDERRNGTSFFLHERGRALEVCGKI
jgi:hypothetical protein